MTTQVTTTTEPSTYDCMARRLSQAASEAAFERFDAAEDCTLAGDFALLGVSARRPETTRWVERDAATAIAWATSDSTAALSVALKSDPEMRTTLQPCGPATAAVSCTRLCSASGSATMAVSTLLPPALVPGRFTASMSPAEGSPSRQTTRRLPVGPTVRSVLVELPTSSTPSAVAVRVAASTTACGRTQRGGSLVMTASPRTSPGSSVT